MPADKRKNVAALKAAMKDASELILATDPDREGESISWHLKELLKPKVKVRRIVFHEITEEAVKAALAEAHDVDENLVRAQESRRILDRLYGYTLSPVLWKKVQTGLSAGRVQSVAVRVIVEREEERIAFRTASYWDLEAKLRGGSIEFVATLAKVGGQRVATGKDFDSKGQLESKSVRLLDEKTAQEFREGLMRRLPWKVTSVEEKPYTQRPAPPFTTSTLQQEANRKLGFGSERTMQIAQRLFQGMDLGGGDLEGLISYHRTDSTTLSSKALTEAAAAVKELYGADYHKGPRQYQTKVRNAQEAHEAIRPTHFHRTPASLEKILESDEMKIYELIWKRAVASQMADAKLLRTSVEITGEAGERRARRCSTPAARRSSLPATCAPTSKAPTIRRRNCSSKTRCCRSCRSAIEVWSPDKMDQDLILLALDAKGHQTSPPARYTEASLVKRLEEEGIGRPSTYAPTVATIQRRGYITRQGKALVPSFTAFAVTRLLRNHFGDYVDIAFTAEMEEILDKISNGEKDWLEFLAEFYRGDGKHHGLEHLVEDKGQAIEYPLIELGKDPDSGLPVRVRIGRYGPFLQLGSQADDGPRASLPEDLAPADLTLEKAIALLQAKAQGPEVARRRSRHRAAGLRDARPLRRLRAAGRNARGSRRQAAARLARPRRHRRHHHARRRLEAAVAAARARHRRRRRADPRQRRPLRPVREAGHRVPLARRHRRRLYGDAGAREGTAGAAEEVDAPRPRRAEGAEVARQASRQRRGRPHSRRPLRPVRHRRHDQRVGAEGHAGRVGDDGLGGGALGRARRHVEEEAHARPQDGREGHGQEEGSAEEEDRVSIVTEIIANALDAGATTIDLSVDAAAAALTIVDDGRGMQRRELARYHDIAASTKRRGEGIGFAGVGIKLGLLVSRDVVTETRRGTTHVATRWALASRHRAPWKWIPPPGPRRRRAARRSGSC